MASPQMPRDELDRWMREIESRVAQVEKRDPLINSGLSVPSVGVTQVDGNLVVQGTFTAVGKINNDALTNPISGDVRNSSGSGFSLTPTLVELAGADITVPTGFTTLLVTAGATVFSYNPNTTGGSNGAGGDAIYSMVGVSSQQSHQNPVGVSGGGGYATSFSAAGFQFTGLTAGTTLRLSAYGSSAYANIAANSNNYANVYASLIWLR